MYGHNLTETGIFAMRCPVFIPHILILLVFLSVPALAPSKARAEDATTTLYQITGIEVDVTAKSAAAARDLAIQTAERKGFEQLAEQLEATIQIDKISDNDLAAIVQNYDVEQEKHSSTRVIGRYTVQFRPAATRRFFDKLGTSYSEKMPDTILVLPVTKANKRFILWEEPTPWRSAWDSSNKRKDSLALPAGDLDDVKLISTNEAIGGKSSALHALADKYAAKGGTVVTILTPATDKDAGKLETSFYDSDGDFQTTITQPVPPMSPNDKPDMMLGNLAKDIKKAIQAKRHTSSGNKPAGATTGVSSEIPTPASAPPHETLSITASVNSLAEWAMIKRQIDALPMVDNTSLNTITRGSAKFDLTYHGDLRALQAAMGDNRMSLGQSGAKGDWIMMIEQPAEAHP